MEFKLATDPSTKAEASYGASKTPAADPDSIDFNV
jgi:hypothetical protein